MLLSHHDGRELLHVWELSFLLGRLQQQSINTSLLPLFPPNKVLPQTNFLKKKQTLFRFLLETYLASPAAHMHALSSSERAASGQWTEKHEGMYWQLKWSQQKEEEEEKTRSLRGKECRAALRCGGSLEERRGGGGQGTCGGKKCSRSSGGHFVPPSHCRQRNRQEALQWERLTELNVVESVSESTQQSREPNYCHNPTVTWQLTCMWTCSCDFDWSLRAPGRWI